MPSLGFDFERFMGSTIFTVFFYALIAYLICVLVLIGIWLYHGRRNIPQTYLYLIFELIRTIACLTMLVSGIIIIYRAFQFRRHVIESGD